MTETLIQPEPTGEIRHERPVGDAAASLEVIIETIQSELPANATPLTIADGVDRAVADLIHDTSASTNSTNTEQALEVGMLEILENKDLGATAIDDTAGALGEADIEALGHTLRSIEGEFGLTSAAEVMSAIDDVYHGKPNIVYQQGSGAAHQKPGWEQLDREVRMEVIDVPELAPPQKLEEAITELTVQHNAATHEYVTTKNRRAFDRMHASRMKALREIQATDLETADLSLVSEGFYTIKRINDHESNIIGYDQQHMTLGLLDKMPEDVLRAMVRSPKDREGGAVRYALNELARNAEEGDPTVVRAIARAYGIESLNSFSTMYPSGTKMSNEALKFVHDNPTFLLHRDIQNEMGNAATKEEKMTIAKNFSREYLTALGLSPELADRAIYAMRGRITVLEGSHSQSRIVEDWSVAEELANFTERVRTLGPENVRVLAEEAGIVNFSNFTIDQLETTLGLVQGDQKIINGLRNGDCSLMIFDGTEDWNGAFEDAGKKFYGAKGRVIAFEISSMAEDAEELAKRIALLEEGAVKVSTLVLGGHGAPGSIGMGDGALGYRQPPEYPSIIPVAQSKTMKRLFGRLKPSSETGRASVIIQSCSQAAPGLKGVSTAMRIAREAGRERVPVDTYATDISTNTLRSSESSIRYADNDAVKFSVDNGGLPKRSRVHEVPLDGAFKRDNKTDDKSVSIGRF